MSVQGNTASHKKQEPLSGIERVEWARVALEEAVARMVRNPGDQLYIVAVASRFHELEEIRSAVLRPRAQPDLRGAALGKKVCPNCQVVIELDGQHFTGVTYVCGR